MNREQRARAACVGTDPTLFYPPQDNHTLAAQAICKRCPVRDECLQYALSFGSTGQFGVWGGTSANYRRRLLRRRDRERSSS